MPKVCRYNKRPGGCKDVKCAFNHPEKGRKTSRSEQESNKKKRKIEEVILIPDEFVGKLLNQVKADCTAYISVSGLADIVETNQREITIRGSVEEINEAKHALFNTLLDVGIHCISLQPQAYNL